MVAPDAAHLWRTPLEQQLFFAMGHQSGLLAVATPGGEMPMAEGERSLFESLVADLRRAIEELCQREAIDDPAQLSWMPSSVFPPSVNATDGRLLEAWDLMTPDERCVVIRAVLGDTAGARETGGTPGATV